MLFARVFSTIFGMLSGPGALFGFNCCRSLMTPGTVIVMGGIAGRVWVGWGSWLVDGRVKTDLNWFRRIFAFVWLSLCSWPFSFRGATPVLSCFLALM